MNYRDTWNLATIPYDRLKQEWARRNAVKAAAKRTRTDVDPERRAYLNKKAESMRRLRSRSKTE